MVCEFNNKMKMWTPIKISNEPIAKKKIKDATEAPVPNKIFWCKIKFFEKLPKKNTVSE